MLVPRLFFDVGFATPIPCRMTVLSAPPAPVPAAPTSAAPPPTSTQPAEDTRSLPTRLSQGLAYAGIRTAMGLPSIAGVGTAAEVARSLGRTFGASKPNRKRVARAADRVTQALPHLDQSAARELVLRSYEHLFQLGVELGSAGRLITEGAWSEQIELENTGGFVRTLLARRPVALITGHCGNWEVLGYTLSMLGFPSHALYRPLDIRPLDRYVQESRARRGLVLVDKFGATNIVPDLMERAEPVGFVADQNAGDRGLFVPYFGRLASTYKTIALVALRYRATVLCGQAVRLPRPSGHRGLCYKLRLVDQIEPEDYENQPDPVFYLTARYRRALEQMVRDHPEQYLWMHRIWKSRPPHERRGKPFPKQLRAKLAQLPWMTDADVEAIVDRSDRDTRWLTENNTERLP